MHLHGRALVATTVLTSAVLLAPGATSVAEGAAPATVTVGGGARMWPAYDPAVTRYAVHPAADGSVRVEVAGADQVWVDGVPDADGRTTVEGLDAGDEVSVFLTTGGERRAIALHVLPESFPTLAAEATGDPLTPGNIALTLDRFDGGASPRFETVVDRHGVPVWTRSDAAGGSTDLKLAANGNLTVQRPTTTAGRTGTALVELDEHFQEVRRLETVGLVDTDNHDSRLLPDGSRWQLAYEPNAVTGLKDSIIQHVDPDGDVVWQWTSAPYADETVVAGNPDYAHINAIDVQPNGDVLASFRHLSSVFLIASTAHDGHEAGDVIWKLGGRDSDFTFPDLPGGEPDVGPCAQHSASILPNGNVLVFDNGSAQIIGDPLCVDQHAPEGDPVHRPSTRVVELELKDGTATPVRTYGDTTYFSWFMGSAARTSTGNVLIGWSSAGEAMATETDASGETVWRLKDLRYPEDGAEPPYYISYRAALVPERDAFAPEVALDGPADGVEVTQGADVPVSFSCTDRGGSTLQSCDGPDGRRLDTSTPGTHTWSVTARDGAGGTTTRTRTYSVTAPQPTPTTSPEPLAAAPDLALRKPGAGWVGVSSTARTGQDVRTSVRPGRTVRATVRLTNAGGTAGRFRLRGPDALAKGDLIVRYRQGGKVRTHAVAGRGWRTPALAPGETLRVTLRVRARSSAKTGVVRTVKVRAVSAAGRDKVRLRVRVRPM